MNHLKTFQQYATQLKLSTIGMQADQLFGQAQQQQPSYLEFATQLLELEVQQRQIKAQSRKLKAAQLPLQHQLEHFDCAATEGMSIPQVLTPQFR